MSSSSWHSKVQQGICQVLLHDGSAALGLSHTAPQSLRSGAKTAGHHRYKVGPPNAISWFIIPINYSYIYIYTINHSYWKTTMLFETAEWSGLTSDTNPYTLEPFGASCEIRFEPIPEHIGRLKNVWPTADPSGKFPVQSELASLAMWHWNAAAGCNHIMMYLWNVNWQV